MILENAKINNTAVMIPIMIKDEHITTSNITTSNINECVLMELRNQRHGSRYIWLNFGLH